MEQNARTKRKMQGRKGKCKDDTKSDSLDRCEQVERSKIQSYVIKSPPWTILWFRILGIFSAENIKRLCVFMFQT